MTGLAGLLPKACFVLTCKECKFGIEFGDREESWDAKLSFLQSQCRSRAGFFLSNSSASFLLLLPTSCFQTTSQCAVSVQVGVGFTAGNGRLFQLPQTPIPRGWRSSLLPFISAFLWSRMVLCSQRRCTMGYKRQHTHFLKNM